MPLQLPRLSKCCCCLPLRVGSLIIGYASVLLACLYLSLISYSIYEVATHNTQKSNSPPLPNQDVKALSIYLSLAYYFLVFTYLLVISLLLVIGVHKRKPVYMRHYFNSGMVLLGLALVLVVVTFVFAGLLLTLPLLKWCFIHFFCLLVVRSTYLEMEEENDKTTNYQMHTVVYNPHQTQPLMA